MLQCLGRNAEAFAFLVEIQKQLSTTLKAQQQGLLAQNIPLRNFTTSSSYLYYRIFGIGFGYTYLNNFSLHKMKSFIIIALLSVAAIAANAQTQPATVDTKAKGILDQVSVKNKGYKTIRAEITYSLFNKKTNTKDNKTIKLWLKGQKYKMDAVDQVVLCDGKTVWKVIDGEEVEISNLENNSESLSPQNLFSIYEKGFKYKFVKEESAGGKVTYIIDLFPTTPKTKDYTDIRLYIDKASLRITKGVVNGKNGSVYTYTIKTFSPNETLADALFTFDKTKYPKAVINDLRD